MTQIKKIKDVPYSYEFTFSRVTSSNKYSTSTLSTDRAETQSLLANSSALFVLTSAQYLQTAG